MQTEEGQDSFLHASHPSNPAASQRQSPPTLPQSGLPVPGYYPSSCGSVRWKRETGHSIMKPPG